MLHLYLRLLEMSPLDCELHHTDEVDVVDVCL